MLTDEREQWLVAFDAEDNSLRENDTFAIGVPPPGVKVISTRDILTKKYNPVKYNPVTKVVCHKVRFVVRGFTESAT